MCDSEHMFECPSTQDSDTRRTDSMVADAISEMEFNRFLQQSIQVGNTLPEAAHCYILIRLMHGSVLTLD